MCQTASAAGFKSIHTNTSWDEADRSVGGTVFSSVYSGGTNSLYATRGDSTKKITGSFNGGAVISDGKTVYYSSKVSGKHVLFKASVINGTAKKLGKLAPSSHYGVDLIGLYKNVVYYIVDVPEGQLYRFSLSRKKAKKIKVSGTTFSIGSQNRKYFVFSDGTGAGYSYIGVYNAAKGKFKKIAKLPKEPVRWTITSKYIYFAELTKGNTFTGKSYTIRVRRYQFSSGKTKTLIKSLKVKSILELTSKSITYVNYSGKTKAKIW